MSILGVVFLLRNLGFMIFVPVLDSSSLYLAFKVLGANHHANDKNKNR